MTDPPAALPPMTTERAEQLIAAFPHARVVIVGDVMVDEFIVGRASRISPEAPVPVLLFDHEERRLGGAANVAHNIATLGGRVTLVSLVGRDSAASYLRSAVSETGIDARFVEDDDRVTTRKVRLVTERNQQVARVDYEAEDEVTGAREEALLTELRPTVAHADALVISDYLKGAVTRRVVREIIELASGRSTPVLVDPKIPHLDYYRGATVVTPNNHEAESATHVRIRTHANAQEAARLFRERSGCQDVLLTRGDQGMWLLGDTAEGYLPASTREVADVTGAGDTVIATLALSIAAGATLVESARLANHAAGVVVGKFGPATVTPAELRQALSLA